MPRPLEQLPALPPLPEIPPGELAAWLQAWQQKNNFSNQGAAARLGLSVSSYRRQRNGRSRVSQQTVLLAFYTDVHRHNWLEVAELAYKLARLNSAHRQ